ncbi:MAG: hypothetical protein NZO58_05860 [Gemmataceae bacterium]|nr:hypothetical protein [Gemmataceae bacterium]
MWLGVLFVCLAAVRPAWGQEQERPPLPDYLKASIADAIERGRNYLQRTQKPSGTWEEGGHRFGYAALPALTLLECGVSPNDAGIRAAADYIRRGVLGKDLINTYEVSLAILFLDRLGNPKDKPYVEILAARLIASQTPTGGWGYSTQWLDAKDTDKILSLIRRLEPLPLEHLLAGRVAGMDNPFVKREPVPSHELVRKRTVNVPKELVLLPCFTQFGTFPLKDPEKPPPGVPFLDRTDNSTTQFALLALWAARRKEYDIPITRTGSMAFMRFHTCQSPSGAWDYLYVNGGSGGTPTMINTGLLGMAIGHGIVKEMKLQDDPPVDEDPRILHGFKALAGHIGVPQDRVKDIPLPNLYFLWGLERVCMLYNVHLIGNRDWYHWGAEALVANQEPDGYWFKKDGYPGASPTIDTCFALMFLRRANLAKDLSAYLAFSPKKLNDGVLKLVPPPKVETKETLPPVVTVKPDPPKPEPPKVEEKKPEPPIQVAETKPTPPISGPPTGTPPPPAVQPAPPTASPAPSSGAGLWIVWSVVGLGGLLIIGGLVFFIASRNSSADDASDDEEEEEEVEDRPKTKKKPRSKR